MSDATSTTPVNWSQLSARERDALVVEKVMGWRRRGYYRDPVLEKDQFYDIWWDDATTRYVQDVRFWSPTTCPKACAAVKAKFAGEIEINRTHDGTWKCVAYIQDKATGFGRGATEEEAVCLCALHAAGIKVTQG